MRSSYLVPLLVLTACVDRVIVERDTDGAGSGGAGEDSSSSGALDTAGQESSTGGLGDTPDAPTPVELNTIYVNSSDTLYTFVPETRTFARVGPFVLDDGTAASVTDIAIDRLGFLYAVSLGTLYVCDPDTVVCTPRGTTSANAAGFAEFGALSASEDVLVLVEGSDVVQVFVRDAGIETVRVGTLEGYSSSGDVMPLQGSLMLLSSPGEGDGDVLVAFDAATAQIVGPLGLLPPLTYGLAGFGGDIWGFTDTGLIVQLDASGEAVEVGRTEVRLWGAATHPDSR